MKLVSGLDILKIGESMAALQRFADSLDPERMNRAIRAGCTEADAHLTCSYPECKCKQMPDAIRKAIATWEQPSK